MPVRLGAVGPGHSDCRDCRGGASWDSDPQLGVPRRVGRPDLAGGRQDRHPDLWHPAFAVHPDRVDGSPGAAQSCRQPGVGQQPSGQSRVGGAGDPGTIAGLDRHPRTPGVGRAGADRTGRSGAGATGVVRAIGHCHNERTEPRRPDCRVGAERALPCLAVAGRQRQTGSPPGPARTA